jgi:micrococcal nuclease
VAAAAGAGASVSRTLIPSTPEYIYRALVIDVIDGDTIRADVDLGFSIRSRQVFRLLGLNTPEMVGVNKAQGMKAKAELADRILGREVIIRTVKDKKEKYGRYLATVFLDDLDVNAWMAERWPTYQ